MQITIQKINVDGNCCDITAECTQPDIVHITNVEMHDSETTPTLQWLFASKYYRLNKAKLKQMFLLRFNTLKASCE